MLDVEKALYWVLPELNAQAGKQAPSPIKEGMLAYADGVNWNPGSGRGIYKYLSGVWWPIGAQCASAQPIFDHTVTGSAVTSITTNGIVTLDGLTHGGYKFEFYLFNPAGATVTWRLYFNNDTTNANYDYSSIFENGTAVGTASAADAILVISGLIASAYICLTGVLNISPNGKIDARGLTSGNASRNGFFHVLRKTADTNVTRLDIVASAAGRIDVGSRVRLWRNN